MKTVKAPMSETTNQTVGRAVARLRKGRHLTQEQLAKAVGLEHAQIICDIEKGRRSLKVSEVSRLASALHVSFLSLLAGDAGAGRPFVLWRKPGDPVARADEEALFLHRCERFAFVEKLNNLSPAGFAYRFPLDPASTSFETVTSWAEQVRKGLGLGDLPAPGLQDALEHQHHIKVLVTHLAGGSGAATRGSFGDGILVNLNEPPGRRAFSLAHEIFHLVTWEAVEAAVLSSTPDSEQRVETLAEVFASSLVLPEETLSRRLPAGDSASWRVVEWVELARELGVTVPALAWRLASLRKVSREQAQKITADPSRGGAGGRPRAAADDELPDRFVTLAFKAYVGGKISIGKLAELLETTVGMVPKTLLDHGFDLDSDVWEAEALPA